MSPGGKQARFKLVMYACLRGFNPFQHKYKACYWAIGGSRLHQAMWCHGCRQVGTFLIRSISPPSSPVRTRPECLINHVLWLVILRLHVPLPHPRVPRGPTGIY